MHACSDFLRDHAVIRTSGRKFTPDDARRIHRVSRDWLARQCAVPFDGKTVVVTHHGPHWNSVVSRYQKDLVSAGFASHLEPLLANVDYWIHGHIHDSVDYQVGRTRVVANPRGYLQTAGGYENRIFKQSFTLNVCAVTD